jgi:paraquat-inducible protein A
MMQKTISEEGQATPSQTLVQCHDCGEFYKVRSLRPRYKGKCGRCGATLYQARDPGHERSLYLSLTALILFVMANAFPFMTLTVEGRVEVNTLFSGVRSLYESGLWPLAVLVFATSILCPLLKIAATLYVLLPYHFGRRLPGITTAFRYLEILRPWAMTEVYLLGVFVAYVNLSDIGRLELGVAVYSFGALFIAMIASDAFLNSQAIWERFGASAKASVPPSRRDPRFLGCHACRQVNRMGRLEPGAHAHCQRCGASLHFRKPNSVARTGALVAAAAILYVPANILPVMTVISFGKGEPDTILSGIKQLIQAELWPLAALVFCASIGVPMLKLVGLGLLVLTTKMGSNWRLRDRTQLYRIIEGIGRWSMIDIFMISILVGLVKLGEVATIEPGVGAISFAGVVIITMIAAGLFDPKLMWDAAEQANKRSRNRLNG